MRFPAKIISSCIWVAIPVDWVIFHWYACGADGRSVYGHVITKFSVMGRFTYPGCSAGARFAHVRAPLKIDRLGIIYISIIARFFLWKSNYFTVKLLRGSKTWVYKVPIRCNNKGLNKLQKPWTKMKLVVNVGSEEGWFGQPKYCYKKQYTLL